MSGTVGLERVGAVAVLTIDNEAKWNALSPPILEALERHLDALDRDGGIAAIVLTGRGERAFCAGADINAWGDLDPHEFARGWILGGHRAFDRIARSPKPVIAAVNGHALGGGLELAAASDLRISVRSATFGLPEASIGVVPGWSGTQRLARQMPIALVKEMALLARRLSAERAFQVGFVNEIVEADARGRAIEVAGALSGLAPRSVEIAKYMINAGQDEGRAAMIDALASGFAASTRDKAEGVASFRAKRKPEFRGE
jgi:enoyl-CoA hydratase